jgi:hypothetical protein
MSLNKWKTWPMEFLEDVLEIDKDLVTTKRGSCDHFLTKIKISEPEVSGDGWIQKKISNRFWYMERWNPSSYAKTRPVLRTDSELEDKHEQCAQNWSRQQGFDGNSEGKCRKLDGVD